MCKIPFEDNQFRIFIAFSHEKDIATKLWAKSSWHTFTLRQKERDSNIPNGLFTLHGNMTGTGRGNWVGIIENIFSLFPFLSQINVNISMQCIRTH